MQSWQVQEAKARFSEVVRGAERDGPQEITLHGRAVAVLVSRAEYDRLTGTGRSLLEFMRSSPLHDQADIDLEREPGLTREVAL
jgi:prevent-host-death family protein